MPQEQHLLENDKRANGLFTEAEELYKKLSERSKQTHEIPVTATERRKEISATAAKLRKEADDRHEKNNERYKQTHKLCDQGDERAKEASERHKAAYEFDKATTELYKVATDLLNEATELFEYSTKATVIAIEAHEPYQKAGLVSEYHTRRCWQNADTFSRISNELNQKASELRKEVNDCYKMVDKRRKEEKERYKVANELREEANEFYRQADELNKEISNHRREIKNTLCHQLQALNFFNQFQSLLQNMASGVGDSTASSTPTTLSRTAAASSSGVELPLSSSNTHTPRP